MTAFPPCANAAEAIPLITIATPATSRIVLSIRPPSREARLRTAQGRHWRPYGTRDRFIRPQPLAGSVRWTLSAAPTPSAISAAAAGICAATGERERVVRRRAGRAATWIRTSTTRATSDSRPKEWLETLGCSPAAGICSRNDPSTRLRVALSIVEGRGRGPTRLAAPTRTLRAASPPRTG